jgi:hypothetical protein
MSECLQSGPSRPRPGEPAARGTIAGLLRHPFWLAAAEKHERVLPSVV